MLEATVRHTGALSFLGMSNSNHWVPMDGSAMVGADDGAARPKELLLLGLGGCTGMDVLNVLRKRRVPLDSLRIDVRAEEAESHPMVFTEIEVSYHFEGAAELTVAEIQRAIELSEKSYCAVSAMLRQGCPIGWRAFLNGEEVLVRPAGEPPGDGSGPREETAKKA
jgi:putative redox protein